MKGKSPALWFQREIAKYPTPQAYALAHGFNPIPISEWYTGKRTISRVSAAFVALSLGVPDSYIV